MMYFLELIDTGSGTLETSGGIFGTMLKAARSLFFSLNELIYKFVAILYNIFESLCGARLLKSEELSELATKIGFLLGVIMMFIVLFDFIQMVLDPDRVNDKQKGAVSIIKKCLLVIVMLGISTFFFDSLYYVQNFVISKNIIYKVLLPANDVEINTKNFGNVLAARTFGSFYTVNQAVLGLEITEGVQCEDYRNLLLNDIAMYSDYTAGNFCLNAYGDAVALNGDPAGRAFDVFIMDYNFLLQTLVGVILVYILVSYVFQVGIRVIQLTVLQMISPMAIVGYLSPKQENLFMKWWKIYFSTYIDVFIRMAIIYFMVYLSADLLDKIDSGTSTFWDSIGNPTGATRSIFVVVMILSLLMFAKKAPDLLKDLFPAGASKLNLGLKSPKEMLKDMDFKPVTAPLKFATAPIGLMTKKTVSGVDSLVHGQGFFKGWRNVHGKFGNWLGKQREQYMPYGYEQSKKKKEGTKEVREIDNNWNEGVIVAKKLMRVGASKAGTGTTGWDKVLNGETVNEKYYKAIFKSQEFIKSKMAVDKESKVEDELRTLQQRVNLEGVASAFSGGTVSIGGKTYDATNVNDLIKDLESQQKKVEGLKNVHESISKQYQSDAQTEAQFKFIKNNSGNPANPGTTRTSRGIE